LRLGVFLSKRLLHEEFRQLPQTEPVEWAQLIQLFRFHSSYQITGEGEAQVDFLLI
jgi:hypothetical protein